MGNDDELARAVGKRMPEVSVEFFPGVDLLTASSVWDTIIGVKGGRIDYLVCEFTEGPVGDFEMEDLLDIAAHSEKLASNLCSGNSASLIYYCRSNSLLWHDHSLEHLKLHLRNQCSDELQPKVMVYPQDKALDELVEVLVRSIAVALVASNAT
jgi:hypothetical protein